MSRGTLDQRNLLPTPDRPHLTESTSSHTGVFPQVRTSDKTRETETEYSVVRVDDTEVPVRVVSGTLTGGFRGCRHGKRGA